MTHVAPASDHRAVRQVRVGLDVELALFLNAVVRLLVDHGAKLDAKDNGSRDTVNGALLGHNWLPVDYAEGLVRVGVQSAIAHPETAALLRKLMTDAGLPVPPPITASVCITPVCR